jgi:hypothetical protein
MPTEYTFTCATCDHLIGGRPVFHLGLAFCCPGCAADGPCNCSYDPDEPHPAHAIPGLAAGGPIGDREPVGVPARSDETESLVGAGR